MSQLVVLGIISTEVVTASTVPVVATLGAAMSEMAVLRQAPEILGWILNRYIPCCPCLQRHSRIRRPVQDAEI